jgi:hypothetical protein
VVFSKEKATFFAPISHDFKFSVYSIILSATLFKKFHFSNNVLNLAKRFHRFKVVVSKEMAIFFARKASTTIPIAQNWLKRFFPLLGRGKMPKADG